MPIMEVHLVRDAHSDQQLEALTTACSRHYAEVLDSPIDRVRVFVHEHRAAGVAVGGVPVSQGGRPAAYFQCLVLAGRPVEQKHALLTGFTDLIEQTLGIDRKLIRGGCWPIPPEDWCIGGTPASVLRATEIAARSAS